MTVCTRFIGDDPASFSRLLQRAPRLRTGQAGAMRATPSPVDQAVHVHVAEAGHPDRQLHPQDPGATSVISSDAGSCSDFFGRG